MQVYMGIGSDGMEYGEVVGTCEKRGFSHVPTTSPYSMGVHPWAKSFGIVFTHHTKVKTSQGTFITDHSTNNKKLFS